MHYKAVCPKDQMMGSVISAPMIQKAALWISVFRRHYYEEERA